VHSVKDVLILCQSCHIRSSIDTLLHCIEAFFISKWSLFEIKYSRKMVIS